MEASVNIIPMLEAGADLSTKQNHFVKMTGDITVNACDAVTDAAIGVLQNKPAAAGRAAAVAGPGSIVPIVTGGALTAGTFVGPAVDGTAVAKVAGTDNDNYVNGLVLIGADKGNLATIMVLPPTVLVTPGA